MHWREERSFERAQRDKKFQNVQNICIRERILLTASILTDIMGLLGYLKGNIDIRRQFS